MCEVSTELNAKTDVLYEMLLYRNGILQSLRLTPLLNILGLSRNSLFCFYQLFKTIFVILSFYLYRRV